MGLWQVVDGHPFVGLSDFVIAAGCIVLSRYAR